MSVHFYIIVMFVSLWRCCVVSCQLVPLRVATVRLGWHYNKSPPAGPILLESQIAGNASRPPSLCIFMSSLITSRRSGSSRPAAHVHITLDWSNDNISSSDVTDRNRMMCHYVKGTWKCHCSILNETNRAVMKLHRLGYRCVLWTLRPWCLCHSATADGNWAGTKPPSVAVRHVLIRNTDGMSVLIEVQNVKEFKVIQLHGQAPLLACENYRERICIRQFSVLILKYCK